MKRIRFCLLTSLLTLLLATPAGAAPPGDDRPVVQAVLFFSPTCPHCHQVINELLVPMSEAYGDQLQVAGVDTSRQGGAALYQAAVQHYRVSESRRGVPTLVVADVVLVGGQEIPADFPGIVEQGLAGGGIGWPDFPGIETIVGQFGAAATPQPATPEPAATDAAPETSPDDEAARCRVGQEPCVETGVPTAAGGAPIIAGPAAPPTATPATATGAMGAPGSSLAPGLAPTVRLVFFWSETCPHCHEVMENTLPPLLEEYGDRLQIASVEVSTDPERYELYLAALELFSVPPERQGVPALFIGDTHLVGSDEIPARLEGLIQSHLEAGGVDYPPIPGLEAIAGAAPLPAVPEPSTTAGESQAQPIHLAYFYQTGCQDCDRVKGDLDYLQTQYPQLAVEAFNVREQAALSEWLGERAGVPESRRLTAPTIFVGEDYLLEEELEARSLERLLADYTPQGALRVWEDWEAGAGDLAQQGIIQRFRSLGVFTVILAGLVDGLNPCAFATLVFFVSYLTISGRKGRQVLSVGGAFTVGVFVAYILVGVGFYHALDLLGDLLTTLGRWLYGLTAAFCLVLAVVSFMDFLKARRGEIGDMALNLPHRLRMQINATIRNTRKSRTFVAAAFVTGVIVSLLELACTGQVYLPTIIFVMSVPELKAQAFLALFLYNVLFVTPLVVVFVLAYYGTGARQFSSFLQRRASAVKLGMSFLFLALGGWLAVSLI